ncbi:MAG: hypothetical protein EBU52_11230 [Cytophagia bacterium]|nr:hypothetical protein [Cytophagia bacterium]
MEIKEFNHKALPFKGIFFPCINNKGSLLIAPAMGITAKYYQHLAAWLSEQGFVVLVIDYQGTGATEDLIKKPITFNDWVKNIEIAGKWLKKNSPDTPLIFVGHSIGSQLFGFVEETTLFDKAIFLASSTGYWKDGHAPQRWINYALLTVILPLANFMWGYTHAKFFKQGENYPKLPALQWKKWCMNKKYLAIDINDTHINNYNYYKNKITSIWFADDPIANEITAPKLLTLYKQAETECIQVHRSEVGHQKIGHSGFLSRKFTTSVWTKILDHLNTSYKTILF